MAVIGIIGGGQLGKMSAMAAARLGIKTVIFNPEAECPAALSAWRVIAAPYNDQDALKEFASVVDVIGFEFESIPVSALAYLQEKRSIYPKPDILEITQHRAKEKSWLNSKNIETTHWVSVQSFEDLESAKDLFTNHKALLKTATMGYDGKGQYSIDLSKITQQKEQINNNISAQQTDYILEEKLQFECEISVIAARGINGQVKCFPPSLNNHKDGILKQSIYPAPVKEEIKSRALQTAAQIVTELDLIGVMGIEFFVMQDGRLLVNEVAPRPHNSGHWTMDACTCDQFEQHIRAITGLDLGDTEPFAKSAEMINLLGEDAAPDHIQKYMNAPHTRLHIYGKEEIKQGRKMGHVNIIDNPL
jgi:5-(carboxyamino)imidazole ribonucleotide synthase